MPQSTVLIYQSELPADFPAEELRRLVQANQDLPALVARHGGQIVAAVELEPGSTATAIRGGMVTDGPFAETKEVVAGVYVLEARDLDHALELAAMTPIVDGGVEVRPIAGSFGIPGERPS
jgi:hypothetical protein